MASVTRDTTQGVSGDTISIDNCPQLTGTAAVAIAAGDFVQIDNTATPFGARQTDATSANAKVAGIVLAKAAVGNPVTVFGKGAKCHYAPPGTLTPGALLYLDVTANAGGLSTTTTTGDAVGVARAISDQDIQVIRDY